MQLADDVASKLARRLRGEVLGTHVAIARRDGYRVRCQIIGGLTNREDSRKTASVIEVGLRSQKRLELWVAKGNPPREAIAFGDEIDIEVGIPTFDDLFHVEGAPVDVVRALFDAELCVRFGTLRDHEPELSTARVDDQPVLRLRLATWDLYKIVDGVGVLITIASRLDEAYEAADAVQMLHGSPFRNEVTPRAMIDDKRAKDFESLARVRRSRTWWRRFQRALSRFTSRRRRGEEAPP